jgi:hypothetical protein
MNVVRRFVAYLVALPLIHWLLLDQMARTGVVAVLFAPGQGSPLGALLLALSFIVIRVVLYLFAPLLACWLFNRWLEQRGGKGVAGSEEGNGSAATAGELLEAEPRA